LTKLDSDQDIYRDHKIEELLWKAAGIELPDKEAWYVQTGQGMLATINVAQEKRGIP